MMFGDFATALPLVQAGKLRALGVSTAQRVGAGAGNSAVGRSRA